MVVGLVQAVQYFRTIIHKGCVIAAGSVVKGVCEANGFYAGVPAVKKKVLL